jgi:PAS domain S-box-containing protein
MVKDLEKPSPSVWKGVSEILKWGQALSQILQAGKMLTWEWDLETDQVTQSANAEELYGVRCRTGQEVFAMVHPEDRAAVEKIVRDAIRNKTSYSAKFRLAHSDGRIQWIEDRGHLTFGPSGEVVRVGGISLDVTEQRLYEEALKRSNEELEQFAHVISHELKSPLRTMFGFADILSSQFSGKLGPDADEFLRFIRESAIQMSRLVDGLLAYSRVTRQSPHFRAVDTQELLPRVLELLNFEISESGAVVEFHSLPVVMGDRLQLTQLFQNLITNAIKFRGESPPRITVSARPEGRQWSFAIADNGVGLDPRYAERVFHLFERGPESESLPGSGLGLAVCRRVVQGHGGRIWLESRPGRGSTVHFTLPTAESEGKLAAS